MLERSIEKREQNRYAEALLCTDSALALARERQDTLMLMQCHHEKGNVLFGLGQHEEAHALHHEVINLSKDYSNTTSIIVRKTCGMAHNGIAQSLIARGEYETALPYAFEALRVEQEMHNPLGQSICWTTVGDIYELCNQPDSAQFCYRKSIEFNSRLNQNLNQSLANSQNNYDDLSHLYRMTIWIAAIAFLLIIVLIIVQLLHIYYTRRAEKEDSKYIEKVHQEEVVISTTPSVPNAPQSETDKGKDFLPHLEQYIHDNIKNGNITSEMICREMGMSATPLRIKLKALTGLSLNNFILEKRMSYARHLVEHTQYPLADISLECGFSSFSYFSQAYKRYFGHSPSQARRQ